MVHATTRGCCFLKNEELFGGWRLSETPAGDLAVLWKCRLQDARASLDRVRRIGHQRSSPDMRSSTAHTAAVSSDAWPVAIALL